LEAALAQEANGILAAIPELLSGTAAHLKEGVFPKGVKVGRKLMWDRRELDRCVEKLFRKAKRLERAKRASNESDASKSEEKSARPRKPR
jgi:hypothetical protein